MFEIQNTFSFNKDSLTQGEDYDYVTRTSQNQGILQTTGFVNKENINAAGVWSLGLLQMDFFYREKPWYAGQFVRKVISKSIFSKKVNQFLTVILNSIKSSLLSVLVRDVDKVFLNTKVFLPVKNSNIDFEFIENFISELEAERISELEAYLSATGLKDYTLTKAEQQALDEFEELDWDEYKIVDLFSINTSKKRFDANKITILKNEGYPYIVRMESNNGHKGFINEDAIYLNEENTISFGQDTATIFYQDKPYFTGDKIKILQAKFTEFSKENAQFFITVMMKSFSLFSWGSSSFNVNILQSQKIQIPIVDNKIDFDYIKLLISAVQKLVIKDVVLYADNKINTTKTVIKAY